MNRSILLVLFACLLAVGVLGALDVIPLGIGGGADPRGGGGEGDLLESGAGEGAGTLVGRGSKPREGDDLLGTEPAAETIPAEVRGTTRNGAVVRGRVVRAEGGLPLVGVQVTLTRPDSLISYLRASPKGRFDDLQARTGTDGRFAFLDVTPSAGYVVRARLGGYAVTSSDELDLRGRETVHVGDLALGAGGGLAGRVLDADRKPVAGARVAATWRISNPLGVILADPDTAPELEDETRTDAEGRFSLLSLEPGPKTVLVNAPSGAADVRRSVSVEAGATKTVEDIVLPGPGFLAGKVQWKNGEPIAGARVFAAPWQQAAMRTVDTDAAGRFRIEWLPESGSYGLGVLVEGLPVYLDRTVKLGSDDLLVELDVPGALRGRVVAAESGRPVTRFAVDLRQVEKAERAEMNMVSFLTQQVKRGLGPTPVEDPSGAFHLPQVAAGEYLVEISAPGYPLVRNASVTVVAGETAEVRVEIPDGHVARGTVLRATGAPIGGARLYVIHKGVEAAVGAVELGGYIEDRAPDAATRGDGSFELPPQTPGRYDVIAKHEDTLPGLLRGVDLRGGDASDLEIRLPPSGGVRGRLLDEHARPVQGGEEIYVLYPEGIVRTQDVEPDGRFEVKGLPVGRCLVRWLSIRTASRFARVIRGGDAEEKRKAYDELRLEGDGEHEIVDGQMAEVTLRLPRRVKVSGRVIAELPEGMRVIGVWLTMPGAPYWIHFEVGADGRYEREFEPGKYRVYVAATNNVWRQLDVEIPDVPTYQLDLRVPVTGGN